MDVVMLFLSEGCQVSLVTSSEARPWHDVATNHQGYVGSARRDQAPLPSTMRDKLDNIWRFKRANGKFDPLFEFSSYASFFSMLHRCSRRIHHTRGRVTHQSAPQHGLETSKGTLKLFTAIKAVFSATGHLASNKVFGSSLNW